MFVAVVHHKEREADAVRDNLDAWELSGVRPEAERAALGDSEAVRNGHDALVSAGEELGLAEDHHEELRCSEPRKVFEEESDGGVGLNARLRVDRREFFGRVATGQDLFGLNESCVGT